MDVISQFILMWAYFDSEEELEQWLEAQKPRRIRVLLAQPVSNRIQAHLELEIQGYPMYVSEA